MFWRSLVDLGRVMDALRIPWKTLEALGGSRCRPRCNLGCGLGRYQTHFGRSWMPLECLGSPWTILATFSSNTLKRRLAPVARWPPRRPLKEYCPLGIQMLEHHAAAANHWISESLWPATRRTEQDPPPTLADRRQKQMHNLSRPPASSLFRNPLERRCVGVGPKLRATARRTRNRRSRDAAAPAVWSVTTQGKICCVSRTPQPMGSPLLWDCGSPWRRRSAWGRCNP